MSHWRVCISGWSRRAAIQHYTSPLRKACYRLHDVGEGEGESCYSKGRKEGRKGEEVGKRLGPDRAWPGSDAPVSL